MVRVDGLLTVSVSRVCTESTQAMFVFDSWGRAPEACLKDVAVPFHQIESNQGYAAHLITASTDSHNKLWCDVVCGGVPCCAGVHTCC